MGFLLARARSHRPPERDRRGNDPELLGNGEDDGKDQPCGAEEGDESYDLKSEAAWSMARPALKCGLCERQFGRTL